MLSKEKKYPLPSSFSKLCPFAFKILRKKKKKKKKKKNIKVAILSFSLQLRLHARQQNRVPRVAESYRGGISRAPDHQLGRDFMGEKTVGIVGRPGDPGNSITYGSVAARLSGLQGTHPFIPWENLISRVILDKTGQTRPARLKYLVRMGHCRTGTRGEF